MRTRLSASAVTHLHVRGTLLKIPEKRIEVRRRHGEKVSPLFAADKRYLRGIRAAQDVFVMLAFQLFDALFVDVALADLNGLDVLERIYEF